MWGMAFWMLAISVSLSAAIIGVDDRREWFEETDPKLREALRSVAALVHPDLFSQSHGDEDRLCRHVRFRDQPAHAFCTGFLIAPNKLVTANHCFKKHTCSETVFWFDYRMENGLLHPIIEARCSKILESGVDEDWAIVEIDPPLFNRPNLIIRPGPKAASGTELALSGFPRGIPLKVARGAQVLPTNFFADEAFYFEAYLDSFGGNSGGPVFNVATYEVEGIFTTGFGEFQDAFDSKTGMPCRELRTFLNPQEATPAWVLRSQSLLTASSRVVR